MELKAKKIDDQHTLYQDALTNDPVAVTRTVQNTYDKKKTYQTKWHPDFRKMYPAADDLMHTNFSVKSASSDVPNHILNKYSRVISDQERDPMRAEYAGKTTREEKSSYGDGMESKTYDAFNLHDEEGNHVATMHVPEKLTPYINVEREKYGPSFDANSVKLTFHGQKPTPEQWQISSKAKPGHDPVQVMAKVRHWLDNKDKEPSFVGHYTHANLKVYKTKLSPEDASEKYMAHMKSQPGRESWAFSRINPHVFYAMKPLGGEYSTGQHHVIDTSRPGIVHHSFIDLHHEKSYQSKPLQEVIE